MHIIDLYVKEFFYPQYLLLTKYSIIRRTYIQGRWAVGHNSKKKKKTSKTRCGHLWWTWPTLHQPTIIHIVDFLKWSFVWQMVEKVVQSEPIAFVFGPMCMAFDQKYLKNCDLPVLLDRRKQDTQMDKWTDKFNRCKKWF